MTAEDIKALPLQEKIQIMEVIWADFRERFDHSEISQNQKDLSDRRRERVRDGGIRTLDWDAVKDSIGKR
ncbi:MAG: addiction module protein [Limisphaerales bacterium]